MRLTKMDRFGLGEEETLVIKAIACVIYLGRW